MVPAGVKKSALLRLLFFYGSFAEERSDPVSLPIGICRQDDKLLTEVQVSYTIDFKAVTSCMGMRRLLLNLLRKSVIQ